MVRFYQPDLGSEPDSPFARDANNKLVRRSYWLDINDRSLVLVMTQGIGAHLTNDEKRAHLTDLKRERLIDQVCERFYHPKNRKKYRPNDVAFLQLPLQMSRRRGRKSEFLTRIRLCSPWSGTLPFGSMCGGDLGGEIPMKHAVAAHLPDEHFIIRVDGRVKSHHRRFLDALREGLQLRDQFPQHDVKVQSMLASRERNSLH